MQETPLPPLKDSIIGVECKLLRSHGDDRGFFREIIRFSDPFFSTRDRFAQWSHSRMTKNVVKAWHYHHVQTDWWYVPIGQIETVLFDNRTESPTFKKKLVFRMGDPTRFGEDTFPMCVHIPPGVLHGCKVLSEEAHLFYITSEIYDPNEEGRFPFDSPLVGHSWGPDVIVADNDRRTFEPIRSRSPLSR
ncbi:MAG: hypothetical protein RL417_2090 [Pseudomonadota bacterium]|jgi:dTDP-4-dehydrorhamnose 3,5-epimerase